MLSIPQTYEARILYYPEARWFKFYVVRTHGMGLPENGLRRFHTARRAYRCKARWEAKNDKPQPVELP